MRTIKSPELLHISGENGELCYGANQEWYRDKWQRLAGCGPVNCSQLLWYLAQTQLGCEALAPWECGTFSGFLALMEAVWEYVTPSRMGVNSTALFIGGALEYANSRSVRIITSALEVPKAQIDRPSNEEVCEFITGALESDKPVAFLNLSNGELKNLEGWHWVTIVGFDTLSMSALIYDQCRQYEIDLKRWLETTFIGGGFVAIGAGE